MTSTNPFNEGSNTSETVIFKSVDESTQVLTFVLENDPTKYHYNLGTQGELDLESAAISLSFVLGSGWTQKLAGTKVTVTYGSQTLSVSGTPSSFPTSLSPDATLSITVYPPNGTPWDPKIKVIAPPTRQ